MEIQNLFIPLSTNFHYQLHLTVYQRVEYNFSKLKTFHCGADLTRDILEGLVKICNQ
jgi:hypothetical protein